LVAFSVLYLSVLMSVLSGSLVTWLYRYVVYLINHDLLKEEMFIPIFKKSVGDRDE
jgi:hypothetical protein